MPASKSAKLTDLPSRLKIALVLLGLSVFINYVDRGNLAIAASMLKDELSLSPSQLGILLSAFFWTYSCMQPVTGWLVDRIDVNWVMAGGFFLWSLATAVTGLVHTVAVLFAARLVLGIGESVAFPCYSKILALHFPEEHRGRANSVIGAGLALGPGFGILAGGMLMARFGWPPDVQALGPAHDSCLPSTLVWKPSHPIPDGAIRETRDPQKQSTKSNWESILMAVNDYIQSQGTTTGNRIVAFFRDRNDAYKAISDLRDHGFTTDQIGLMTSSPSMIGSETSLAGNQQAYTDAEAKSTAHDEGFWHKVKDFFTGEDHADRELDSDYDYSETVSGMNWDQNRSSFYRTGLEHGGALVSVTGSRTQEARSILQKFGGDLRESGFTANEWQGAATTGRTARNVQTGSSDISGDREQRILLRGEILRTHRERVKRGEVRLRKEVVTENQTVEVPVTREELVIERVTPTDREAASGEIGSDKEIRVPLSEERVRVDKQPVVNEEVRVGKRAVQRNERVSDDVRHEELRVDKDGDVDVQQDAGAKRKKPAA